MTIVGVVKDHKYRSIEEEPIPMAWYMYAQIPITGKMHVELRVHGEPLAILPSARKVLQQMDPNLPLIEPITQRAQYETTISQQLLFARLAGFFGLLAVLLVATGLYGTLAYRVNNRTVEIGVRMAVGAQRRQVVWMVLRDSLMLTAIGVAIGVPVGVRGGKRSEFRTLWSQALRRADLFHGDRRGGIGGCSRQYDPGAQGRECRSAACAASRVIEIAD